MIKSTRTRIQPRVSSFLHNTHSQRTSVQNLDCTWCLYIHAWTPILKPSRNPKTQRSKRALAAREPKLVENVKKSLVLKGPSSSQVITSVLKDMHKLKQPESKMFSRRNLTRPFEDASSVEFLGSQNDCSLFAYGSNSKKRRHNLVLGRLFDFQLLDMLEMGVDGDTFKPMQFFSVRRLCILWWDVCIGYDASHVV